MPYLESPIYTNPATAARVPSVTIGLVSLAGLLAVVACSAPNESNGVGPDAAGSSGNGAGPGSSTTGAGTGASSGGAGQVSSSGAAGGGGGASNQGGRASADLGGSTSAGLGESDPGGQGPSRGGTTASSGGTSAQSGAGGRAAAGVASNGGALNGGSSGGGASDAGTSGSGGAASSGGRGGASGGTSSGGHANSGGSAGSGSNPSGPVTVWIAGDSTVQNCSSSCPCGWGGQIQTLFSNDVTVVNSAIGGRSVRSWLYLKTLSTADASGECDVQKDTGGNPQWSDAWSRMTSADGIKPGDYLFIQFGINDGARTCDTQGAEGRHVGIDAFKSAYGMMAEAARSRGASSVFVTPVSAISCSGSTAQGTRGDYVTATIDAGRTNGVPVIDLHAASIKLYNQLKFCPIPGGDNEASFATGDIGAFFCKDHTHFEAKGALQIAGLIAQGLRDLNHPLAAYLK